MRYVRIDKVSPGDIPARDVTVYQNGQALILCKGTQTGTSTTLSSYAIARLIEKGVKGIYVEDKISSGINVDEAIPSHIRNLTLSALDNNNVKQIETLAEDIVKQFEEVSEIDLNRMMNETSYIERAMTVCELALSLGKKLGYKDSELNTLAASALLAEIGLILTDKEKQQLELSDNPKLQTMILNMKVEETYPLISKAVVAKSQLSPIIIHSVLFHQENENGTGLLHNFYSKFGIKMKEIEIREQAKIIHICTDYVNALIETNDPIEARNIIGLGVSQKKYNQDLATAFLKFIPIYPIGTIVILSNNEKAIVTKNNNEIPESPIVRLETGEVVDLTKVLNVVIDHIEYEVNLSNQIA